MDGLLRHRRGEQATSESAVLRHGLDAPTLATVARRNTASGAGDAARAL